MRLNTNGAFFFVLIIVVITVFGCGPRETVVPDLGNAENSLFTPDNRLFLTGAEIWEIKQDEQAYTAVTLTENLDCLYTGIAYYSDHIFAVCTADGNGDAWLVRAELSDVPVFEKIFQLSDFFMANGMAIDTSGRVYIADETIINKRGKIVTMTLTNDTVPQVIPSTYRTWLKGKEGAQSPNGVAIIDNHLFFTNFDLGNFREFKTSIKRVAIEGDQHGAVETVFERIALSNSSFLDDLTTTTYGGTSYLIAADYLRGSILAVEAFKDDQATPLYETEGGKFAGPTSCIVGQGLGFGATDLLVTEGGVVGVDPNTKFGNRLSVVRYQPEE